MADTETHAETSSSAPALNLRTLSAEHLPRSHEGSVESIEEEYGRHLDDEELEGVIKDRISAGDELAQFLLGQFYFERERYQEAVEAFRSIEARDYQAKYQLGVMFYDGLGVTALPAKGVKYMKEIVDAKNKKAVLNLLPGAQYNIGRACFEGFGTKQSDEEAESWWLKAAQDGAPPGSVKAQTALALYYSRPGEDSYDLKKAYFWHQEATGNGSLESQGALGVMFEYGIGVPRDSRAAFRCLKEAAERGNVYAQGNLAVHYYKAKLYTKAADVARSTGQLDDANDIAKETDCLPLYIGKGIALASFVFARCLEHGHGVTQNVEAAKNWYSRAASFDLDTVAKLQDEVTFGYL